MSATAGNGFAAIDFSAPVSSGSDPILHYTVTGTDLTDPSGDTGIADVPTVGPVEILNLINGDSYVFTVTATTAIGTGPASAPSAVVTPRGISTSTTLRGSAGPATPGATVSLTATVTPAPEGGAVSFEVDGAVPAGCGALAVDPVDGDASCEVTGLAAGSHSAVAVYRGNARYEGSRSAPFVLVVEQPSSAPATQSAAAPSPPGPAGPTPTVPRPRVDLTYSPNNRHRPDPDGGPRWTFHFSDPTGQATFLCRLDRARFRPCSSPLVFRHLRRGRHVFQVKAIADGTAAPVRTVRFFAGRRAG